MSVIDTQFRTITCNGPKCDKTVTYDVKQANETIADEKNAWLHAVRFTSTSDGRNFAYCSDTCELEGIGTGIHNKPETKKIVDAPATPAAVAAAAAAAKQAEDATKALKAGGKVTIS